MNYPTRTRAYYEPQYLPKTTIDQSLQKYEQLIKENLFLKSQIQKARSKPQYYPTYIEPQMVRHQTSFQQRPRNIDQRIITDHYLSQMMQRNRYLQEKIQKLREQHSKQYSSIRDIRSSQKWENRMNCNSDTCYQDKYLQLLRVRSPFY